MKKRTIGLLIAVVLVVLFCLIPSPEGMDPKGMTSLGIFLGALALFISQAVPMSITCLVIMIITPWFGIGNLNQVWADFGGSSFFFLFFTFALMHALTSTTIPKRIVSAVIKASKGNSKGIVFGIMFVTAIISAFMTNFGTLLIVLSVVNPLLTALGCKPGESGLGRSLILGIPLICCVGGMMTPAGMPGNLIAMNLMAAQGFEITFLKWTLVFLPLGLITTLIICFALVILFKPENLDASKVNAVANETSALGPMQRNEKLVLAIYAVVIVCWFASTWVPILNTAAVAAVAVFIMFLPGVDLIDWKKFAASTNWDILFVVGGVAVAMGCVNTTGALSWVVNTALGGLASMSSFAIFFIVGIVCCVARACIPTGPAVPAILCPITISLAALTGVNVVALSMLPVIATSYPLLLTYTEPIYLYSMGEGWYKPFDLDKFGVPLNIVLCLVCAVLFPMVF